MYKIAREPKATPASPNSSKSKNSHFFFFRASLSTQTILTMKSTNADRNAVLIFDWDDTICPSSFVDKSRVETFEDLPIHVSDVMPCDVTSRAYVMFCNSSPTWSLHILLNEHFSLDDGEPFFSLFILLSPSSQFQKLFNEVGRCAAKCLEVASRHGEVSIARRFFSCRC